MIIPIPIERAKENHRSAVMRLLKQANMHYIPSREVPRLTYENYFVALLNGKVVGFCGYSIINSEEAKTELMVVDKEHRNKGIGYALQVRRMEDMLKKGIRTLTTETDLPENVAWYKRHFGYTESGKRAKFHEFGDRTINDWTILKVDLKKWEKQHKKG
jgi:N-acetylglutamate synthase-like GNAT family acetyltransferase